LGKAVLLRTRKVLRGDHLKRRGRTVVKKSRISGARETRQKEVLRADAKALSRPTGGQRERGQGNRSAQSGDGLKKSRLRGGKRRPLSRGPRGAA